jgi:hypothetical protein
MKPFNVRDHPKIEPKINSSPSVFMFAWVLATKTDKSINALLTIFQEKETQSKQI